MLHNRQMLDLHPSTSTSTSIYRYRYFDVYTHMHIYIYTFTGAYAVCGLFQQNHTPPSRGIRISDFEDHARMWGGKDFNRTTNTRRNGPAVGKGEPVGLW